MGCHFLLQCMKVKVQSLSPVRLLATPWTAAYQSPPSMGFSRQEYWSGVPLPSLKYIYLHICITEALEVTQWSRICLPANEETQETWLLSMS